MATPQQWKARQHRLNMFTSKYLKGVGKIAEDGKVGPHTRARIKHAQYYLGWDNRTNKWSDKLDWHLRYPHSVGKGNNAVSRATLARGLKRRIAQRAHWVRSHVTTGVTTYDGVRVAAWMVPYMQWARKNGWYGHLVSGYRDPAYSEHLCYAMCGAPRCPGRCAGRSSNHSGSVKPRGAIDVSDYYTFARVISRCPYSPRIYNSLPSDRVHFSSTGN